MDDVNTPEAADAPPPRASHWIERLALGALLIQALILVLRVAAPTPQVASQLTTAVAVRGVAGEVDTRLAAALKRKGLPEDTRLTLRLRYEGPPEAQRRVRDRLSQLKHIKRFDAGGADGELLVRAAPDANGELAVRVVPTLTGQAPVEAEAASTTRRVGDWAAVLPPIVAVVLALLFKRLILAMLAACWLGAMIKLGSPEPLGALLYMLQTYIWKNLSATFNFTIIAFTLSLVGMVHVLLRMGGLAGLLDQLGRVAKGAASTRLVAAAMGMVIFFDDYANTIVVGSTMRPVTDARRISREKLAYIVDSTSAPVAGLALISTWIGYEVGLFQELSAQLMMGKSGYEIFFDILGLRFYCLLTLVFVLSNAALGRDFGPMRAAEARAARGELLAPGARPLGGAQAEHLEPHPDAPRRWYNAVIPIVTVLLIATLGMFWSGWSSAAHPGGLPSLLAWKPGAGAALSAAIGDLGSMTAWRDAFSNADNITVLFYAAITGSVLAIGLAVGQRILTPGQALIAWARAIPNMRMAVAILVLAWAIRSVCDDLGTSVYLVGAVQDLLSPQWLPLLTFMLAAAIAFATGTSWGTMGILLPAMIPLAHAMTAGVERGELLLLLCFGAVLDGAIFGDHCSPISDTTVMSSIASGCDHLHHVRTQVPYAITTMLAAASCGYIGVAFGLSPALALLLGAGGLIGVLLLVASPPSRLSATLPLSRGPGEG